MAKSLSRSPSPLPSSSRRLLVMDCHSPPQICFKTRASPKFFFFVSSWFPLEAPARRARDSRYPPRVLQGDFTPDVVECFLCCLSRRCASLGRPSLSYRNPEAAASGAEASQQRQRLSAAGCLPPSAPSALPLRAAPSSIERLRATPRPPEDGGRPPLRASAAHLALPFVFPLVPLLSVAYKS